MDGAIGSNTKPQAVPTFGGSASPSLGLQVQETPASGAMQVADKASLDSKNVSGNAKTVSLLEDPPVAPQTAPAIQSGKKKDANPWGIRSVNFHYSPMLNTYAPSTMHFKQPGYGTDLTIHDVHAKQRTSFSAFYDWPNGWLQIDEPQASTSLGVQFNNGFGLEANVKHNKYIVPDIKQEVHYTGTVGGQAVDNVQPLGNYLDQYEICTGLNEVSIEATHSFKLPAFSPKDRFELISKAGPSVLINNPRSRVINPQGENENNPDGAYKIGGYGATVENEFRYEIRKHVSVSLAHAVSYANLTNVPIPHGTATQSIWANQFSFGLGYTFNTHHKPKS